MLALSLALAAFAPQGQGTSTAPVVINEFVYDDSSTDDVEFVELYNRSGAAIDISGWVLDAKDSGNQNAAYTIPAGTILTPGGFWTLGADLANPGKIDQVVGLSNLWENGTESMSLMDTNGRTIDTLVYYAASSGIWDPNLAEGDGMYARHFFTQIAGVGCSFQRIKDGVDNDNSGRDFFFAPATPGASNYSRVNLPYFNDFESQNVGDPIDNAWAASWARGAVIDPTSVGTHNHNSIPLNPNGGNNAMILWDATGGGDTHYMITAAAKDVVVACDIYIDGALTLPASGEGETWSIGVRGMDDSYGYHVDLSGAFPATASEMRFGQSGIHAVFQRDEIKSELYLIDFYSGGSTYTILGSIPIVAGTNDGWQSFSLEANGNTATMTWAGQVVKGTAKSLSHGGITMAYRERFTTNSLARPLTIDNLSVSSCDAQAYAYGHASAWTGGTPSISSAGTPKLGSVSFFVNGSGMMPGSAPFICVGLERATPLDFGAIGGPAGSEIYVDIIAAVPVPANAAGDASYLQPIPNQASLCGVKLAFQYLMPDFGLGIPLPLATTEGLSAVVGL